MTRLILAQSPDIQNTGLLICILHGIKRDALQALQPSALPSVELQIPGCDIPGHLVQAYSVEITYSLLHPVLLYNQADLLIFPDVGAGYGIELSVEWREQRSRNVGFDEIVALTCVKQNRTLPACQTFKRSDRQVDRPRHACQRWPHLVVALHPGEVVGGLGLTIQDEADEVIL